MTVQRDFATLARTTRRISGTLDPDEVVAAVLESVQAFFPGGGARLWSLGGAEGARALLGSIGLEASEDAAPVARGTGLAATVDATGEPAVCEDLIGDPRYLRKDWARREGLASCILLPLIGRDGNVFGRLSIFTRERHAFDRAEVDLLQAFANQVAISLGNARLHEQSRQRAERLRALARVSTWVVDGLDLEGTLSGITREAAQLLALEGAGLRLLEDGALRLRSAHGLAEAVMLRPMLDVGESLTGRVATLARPIALPDVTQTDDVHPEHLQAAKAVGVRAYIGAPVRHRDRVIGVLIAFGSARRDFDDEEVAVFGTYADFAAIAIENARLYEAAQAEIALRAGTEEELRRHRDRLSERVAERTAELRAAQASLLRSERLAALGQLTGSMSHELRTPLGTVRNALALIRRVHTPADARISRALDMAERGITRCDALVTEFLEFSRTQEFDCLVTNVDDWVATVLDEQPPREGIRVERDLRCGVRVPLDRERMQRALRNVLDNAMEAIASSDSGGCVRVATEADAGADAVRIRVEDDGPGMDAETRAQIFEPLFTTKSFGVGLGMVIVRQVLERHGGRVEVRSAPGSGSTVDLVLPRQGP